MTREEIIKGLNLLEDNMVYFDELQNDKGTWIDVHELLFEAIEVLSAEPCEGCDYKEWLKGEVEPKTDILGKIKAEIEFIPTIEWKDDGTTYILASYFKKQALEIIDKYKAESEE